jgi:hypothetical protein
VARPTLVFQLEAEPGEVFSLVGIGDLSAKSGRPVVGGGVVGEQAGRGTDRIGGRREGSGSMEGFSVAEGISGGERTVASQSMSHQRGPSGWGGSTQQCGAWGGVETVGGGLERVVRGCLSRP